MNSNATPNQTPITKHVKLQISGDADAVQVAIGILHRINFLNGADWSQAIRKRGERSIVRVASREVQISENL
jgi:hypothetical protein